jgi:hypothetical protein
VPIEVMTSSESISSDNGVDHDNVGDRASSFQLRSMRRQPCNAWIRLIYLRAVLGLIEMHKKIANAVFKRASYAHRESNQMDWGQLVEILFVLNI